MSASLDPPAVTTDTTTDPEPSRLFEDDELAQRLDAYELAVRRDASPTGGGRRTARAVTHTRLAVLVYLNTQYVRRDATRPPPSPPGSYKAARGILPWRPGDEPPEERIRRLRDDRRHTLYLDDAGRVAGGAPDFEGDDGD